MKKTTYSKPDIFFDSFELSVSIASCSLINSNQASYVCPVLDPEWGMTIFADLNTCDMTNDDKVCYDIPTGDPNVYVS